MEAKTNEMQVALLVEKLRGHVTFAEGDQVSVPVAVARAAADALEALNNRTGEMSSGAGSQSVRNLLNDSAASDETPLHSILPNTWPTVGDLRKTMAHCDRFEAAATDLLAALKYCLRYGGLTINSECERVAIAAISKAPEETP
jgi:hypothetical protein